MNKQVLSEINRNRELMGLSLIMEAALPFSLKNVLLEWIEKTGKLKNLLNSQNLSDNASILRKELESVADGLGMSIDNLLNKIDNNTLTIDEFDSVTASLLKSGDEKLSDKIYKVYLKNNSYVKNIDDLIKTFKTDPAIPKATEDQIKNFKEKLIEVIENSDVGVETKKYLKELISKEIKLQSGVKGKISNIDLSKVEAKGLSFPLALMKGQEYEILGTIRPAFNSWIQQTKIWRGKEDELILDLSQKIKKMAQYQLSQGFEDSTNVSSEMIRIAKDFSASLNSLAVRKKASYKELMDQFKEVLTKYNVDRPAEVIDFINKYDTNNPSKTWLQEAFWNNPYVKMVDELFDPNNTARWGTFFKRLLTGLSIGRPYTISELKASIFNKDLNGVISWYLKSITFAKVTVSAFITLWYTVCVLIYDIFAENKIPVDWNFLKDKFIQELKETSLLGVGEGSFWGLVPFSSVIDDFMAIVSQIAQGKIDIAFPRNAINKLEEKTNEIDEQKKKINDVLNNPNLTEEQKADSINKIVTGKSLKVADTTETTTEEIPLEEVQSNLISQYNEEYYSESVYKLSYEDGEYKVCYNEDCDNFTIIEKNENGEWVCKTSNESTNNKKWPCFVD